jgi:hypothetical protein
MNLEAPLARHKAAFAAAVFIQLVFVASLPTGFLHPLFVEAVEGHGQASDFFGVFQAGSNLVGGHSIYDSDDYLNEAPRAVPFFYFYRYLPPTAYLASIAALLFSPWAAYWIWVAINEILLALMIVSILRAAPWPAKRRWVAAALWLGFFPFYIEQVMGQFSFTMAVFLWLLWRHEKHPPQETTTPRNEKLPFLKEVAVRWRGYVWNKDRPGPLSVLLAWSASLTLKSFSAFLSLPYLRDGRLKRVLAGAGVGALVCVPYFAFRPRDLVEFARLNFSPFTPKIYKGSMGFRTLLRDVLAQVFPDGAPETFGYGLDRLFLIACAGLVLLLALWAMLRMRRIRTYFSGSRCSFWCSRASGNTTT